MFFSDPHTFLCFLSVLINLFAFILFIQNFKFYSTANGIKASMSLYKIYSLNVLVSINSQNLRLFKFEILSHWSTQTGFGVDHLSSKGHFGR